MKITAYIQRLLHGNPKTKNIALVLGGGGARGLAHIGAIEVLEERGYHITSISGSSIGALIGGFYAAGKLSQLKEIAMHLNKKQIISLMDFSPGLDHIASGDKLMDLMSEILGDEPIEDLPIKFCCCASDVITGTEKVFREGKLRTAIRASISIPCFFKPVSIGNHIYVDGSIHNTLPLNRVERKDNDILVAVNVSAPDSKPFTTYLSKKLSTGNDTEKTFLSKLPFSKIKFSANYMNMMLRIARISIQNNTQMAMEITPPDICTNLPMDEYSIFDFDKAMQIYLYGKEEMGKELDRYEAKHQK